MTNEILTMGLLLCAGHWLADYPLQSDFLVKAKVEGPLRAYHLVAHVDTRRIARIDEAYRFVVEAVEVAEGLFL